MPDGGEAVTVKVLGAIGEVDAQAWDACAGGDNPFVSHAFLEALEDSGSVSAETGWLPRHLVVEEADGTLMGAAPCYLKSHSYGEYVFDWGWADAFERAGGQYYPKLQVSVPFSPVGGPRLLTRPGPDSEQTERILLAGEVADPSNLPSGCAFHPRCRHAQDRCRLDRPELAELGDGRQAACHFA